MVAGVAHESRNALQQIQACSGLLQWRLEGDAEAAALVADLQKALDGLLRLFDDLRGYAAPVTLELKPCNVRDVLAEAWSALAASRGPRDATLHTSGGTHDAACLADPLRLQQVFRNILENSLGACEDPVVIEAEITDAIIAGSPALRIVFRDNGPGFTPEQQQRAFEPFYTTKVTGTGLGMGIAKRIVEAHGGEIALGNCPTRGAEIRITLPRGER
jgi:signal transduction histidine kinase